MPSERVPLAASRPAGHYALSLCALTCRLAGPLSCQQAIDLVLGSADPSEPAVDSYLIIIKSAMQPGSDSVLVEVESQGGALALQADNASPI